MRSVTPRGCDEATPTPTWWYSQFAARNRGALVPLEAMGLGRPVVSTAEGGTAEFVRDGQNALVIRPDDSRGLAAAVRRLAADSDLRAALVEGGRQTAARHTAAEFDRLTLDAITAAATRTRR